MPYFNQRFGNASSKSHVYGSLAEEAVAEARNEIASLIGSKSTEIIFTSGATESINLVLKGLESLNRKKGNHIITWATEHRAVLDTVDFLSNKGFQVTLLPVLPSGQIDFQLLKDAVRPETMLAAIMLANNETGIIQPVSEITKLLRPQGIMTLCDATQAIGKVPVNVSELNADFLAFSAHKFYGPKGIGGLYISSVVKGLQPLIHGGGHEKSIRSGTLNVPGIVGMGKAAAIAKAEMVTDFERMASLKEIFENQLMATGKVKVNGVGKCLPNTSNLQFISENSELILGKIAMKVAASSGSACSSVVQSPSHVLKAMGLSDKEAFSSIRFSLGKFTTKEEISLALETIKQHLN